MSGGGACNALCNDLTVCCCITYPDMKRRNVNVHIMLLEMATDIVEEVRRTMVQRFPS